MMEKVKERTSKYEISIRQKNNKYYEARISLNFGNNCRNRLQKGGTTREIAAFNLLLEFLSYIDISFSNGLITTKIDDVVSQRLFKSINELGIATIPEITQKAYEIVNKINYINSCILNTINLPSNVVPFYNPISIPPTTSGINTDIMPNTYNSNCTVQNQQPNRCIIEDLANEWIKYRLSLCIKTIDNPKPLSQNTVDNNFNRLSNDILPYFKENKILYLSQVTEDCIRDLIKSINCQNSKHKSYIVLNLLFKYAIKHNKATYNPVERVEKPPEKIVTGEEDDDDNYIEPDSQDLWLDLFEKENTDMSLLFETMLLTGLRPEEACGLKWKAFNIEKKELDINNAFKSFNLYNEDKTKVIGHYRQDAKLKTPDSYRQIPILQKRLLENLIKHKRYQQELFKTSRSIKSNHRKWSEDEYIFLGRNYHPYVPDSLANGLTKFRNKYGLTKKEDYVTPYGLRRSFATYWSSKGMHKLILMRLMGHSNYETTVRHYIKVSAKQIKEEMERLEKAS